MIEYRQIGDVKPRDVEVITDDTNAEMAAFEEVIAEGEFPIELPKDRSDDGKFHFTIPGDAVGEFSDFTYDIDQGLLETKMEEWNEEALDKAEND